MLASSAALALLAVTAAVRHVLPGGHAPGGARVNELAARLDTEASPMGQVIPRLRMTIVAAQGGMGGS